MSDMDQYELAAYRELKRIAEAAVKDRLDAIEADREQWKQRAEFAEERLHSIELIVARMEQFVSNQARVR